MKNREKREAESLRPEITIQQHGYEWILVECTRDKYTPCALGKRGYAIKGIKRIKKKKQVKKPDKDMKTYKTWINNRCWEEIINTDE